MLLRNEWSIWVVFLVYEDFELLLGVKLWEESFWYIILFEVSYENNIWFYEVKRCCNEKWDDLNVKDCLLVMKFCVRWKLLEE